MADDIATQYRAYREGGRSWFPRDLLPRDLDLVTVTTPSSYRADVSNGNWSQALLDAERRVAAVGRVDVALVAAGAYGLPLGDFATRSMGATTIYVGGALQLFFGLRGLRWTEAIRPFENEAWSCPSSRPRGNTQGMEARGLGPYWCAPDRR